LLVFASLQSNEAEHGSQAETDLDSTGAGNDDGSLGDIRTLGGLGGLGNLGAGGLGGVLGLGRVLRLGRMLRLLRLGGMLRLGGSRVVGLARDPSRASGVSLSDGARAVSDGQSARLSDDVVLASEVEAGRTSADSGVDIVHTGDGDGAVLDAGRLRSRRDNGGLNGGEASKGNESGGVE
jgi:hypothetical protein